MSGATFGLQRVAVHLAGFSSVIACFLLSACATSFKEDHYFQLMDPKSPGAVTNYYRLKVSGYGALSSARYVSGYYDERAVDLFFNELKIDTTPDPALNGGSTRLLFQDQLKSPGSDEIIKPLEPGRHGAFVMILSTNASSVARTIGQFAENQVVADAITNLMNRDVLLSGANEARVSSERANAAATEVARLIGLVPSGDSPSREATESALVRVLSTIATDLAGAPQSFATLNEAQAWFALRFAARRNVP